MKVEESYLANLWPIGWPRMRLLSAFDGFALVNNTAVETALVLPGAQFPTDGHLPTGLVLRGKMGGNLAVTGTPTLKFRARYGVSNFSFNGTIASWLATPSDLNTQCWWDLDLFAGVRINLSLPTLVAHGSVLTLGDSAGHTLNYRPQGSTSATGIALNDSQLDLSLEWSAADPANTFNMAYCYWWYELPDQYLTNIGSEI